MPLPFNHNNWSTLTVDVLMVIHNMNMIPSGWALLSSCVHLKVLTNFPFSSSLTAAAAAVRFKLLNNSITTSRFKVGCFKEASEQLIGQTQFITINLTVPLPLFLSSMYRSSSFCLSECIYVSVVSVTAHFGCICKHWHPQQLTLIFCSERLEKIHDGKKTQFVFVEITVC